MVIFQFAMLVYIYIYYVYIQYIYIYVCMYVCIYNIQMLLSQCHSIGKGMVILCMPFFGISKRNAAAGCATSSVRFVAKAMSSRIEWSNSQQTPQTNHEFYRNFMVQSHAFLRFLQIFCQIIPFFTSPAPTNP